MRVTARAPFRRGRFGKAVAKTRPFIQVGWCEAVRTLRTDTSHETVRLRTPDQDFAQQLGLQIRPEMVGRNVGGGAVEMTRHRIVIPFWQRRNAGAGEPGVPARSKLFDALNIISGLAGPWQPKCGGLTVWPDQVIESAILKPSGGYRYVYAYSYADKVLRRMVLDALQAVADPRFSDCSHAYRPGRSRFTALAQARDYSRRGLHWACEADISGFFPAISSGLADLALRGLVPEVSAQLRWLATSGCHPTIWRRPNHPGRVARTTRKVTPGSDFLKQGDPLAAFLANVVGDQFIDKPFGEVMGERARLLRYSDNLLVLSRNPEEAEAGIAVVEALLDVPNMSFSEDKTKRSARDVNVAPFFWLGKILRGGNIQTPENKVKEFVQELAITDTASADFKSLAMRVCDELSLDKVKRVEFLRRSLGRSSQLHLGAFDLVRRAWLRRRGVEVITDQEPDEQAAEEVLAAEVSEQVNNGSPKFSSNNTAA